MLTECMASRKGSPNRNKSFLLNRLQDMYGEDFHPIIKIAENCVELQDNADSIEVPELTEAPTVDEVEAKIDAQKARVKSIQLANAEWSRIAEYTEPKLKATELSGPNGGDIGVDHLFTVEFVNAPPADK